MVSLEGFNAPKPKEESFEHRMQDLYISPMTEVLGKVEELFPLDQNPELSDLVREHSWEIGTMSEGNMDETELKSGLESMQALSEKLDDPTMDREAKLSLSIETLKNLRYWSSNIVPFLESLKKEDNLKMFNIAQEIGVLLFIEYPDYEKYEENLKNKSMYDDVVFKDGNPFNGRIPREEFKKLYGTYQISKKEYDSSRSSIDATNEKLIHDFGVLPEIEEDVDFSKVSGARDASTG